MSVKHVAGTEVLCFPLNLCLEPWEILPSPCLPTRLGGEGAIT
jgi:hypothetical protein